ATFKPLLAKLVHTPDAFTPADLHRALEHLFTPDAALPEQTGAFLAALHIARVEHRPDMLAAAAASLRARARAVRIDAPDGAVLVDIVGTGGDGHNTFNVSTTAAIVAAGTGAVNVVKHGSRASTSSSGSADLLQSLGCIFTPPPTPPSPTTTPAPPHVLRTLPFRFLLAPHYHPALALLAPARRALSFRTLFNLLGPLLNPASPPYTLIGVADPALGAPFAAALAAAGARRALIVCGAEGLDEISCAGPTRTWEMTRDSATGDAVVVERTLEPGATFGLPTHALASVAGGAPADNADTLRALLALRRGAAGDGGDGEGEVVVPARLAPVLDFVLMNAAALLVVAGAAPDYKAGVRMAREAIVSGGAERALAAFVEETRAEA
ncbi:hypothetical protein HETIRDRAFT_239495, partial [Heterobasidion irregulare TC 32-1]